MNNLVNASIYIIYVIIALVSVTISYKVSLTLTLIVVALEYVRLLAIYKKVYMVILLVFILNLTLLTYNSYKTQKLVKTNNNNTLVQNKLVVQYLESTSLKASTFKDLSTNIKDLESVELEYWFISLVYVLLELSLMSLVFGVNRQNKQAQKTLKTQNRALKKASSVYQKQKPVEIKQKNDILNGESLEFVGSFRAYAKKENIATRKAQELFKTWKEQGLLVKQNGKNYLKQERYKK